MRSGPRPFLPMIGAIGPRVPAHQITTRNLGAAYPFIAEAGLGQRGVVIGDDLLGGSFVFDPFELYAQGVVSNPNMVVFGQIGRGKSAFVKTFLWRQAVFGRRAWVVDPKGEYGDLAAAWGVRPVALRPGGAIRLNPLDPGPDATAATSTGEGSTARRQMELLASLASACLGRNLLPRERAALGVALAAADRADRGARRSRRSSRRCSRPPPMRRGRCAPDFATCWRTAATWRSSCAAWCTATCAGCSTGRLRRGSICRPRWSSSTSRRSTPRPRWASSWPAPRPGCRRRWPGRRRARRPRRPGLLGRRRGLGHPFQPGRGPLAPVVVEAVACLRRLQRGRAAPGPDLHSVGASDSEQVALAQGLLADSETRVIYAQSPGELAVASDLLSLSSTEAALLPQLRRGVALWKVGQGRSWSNTG